MPAKSSRSLGAFDNEREKPRPNLDSGVETSEESDNLSSGGVGKTHQDQQTQRQHRRQHRKQQEQQQQRQQLSEQRQQEQRLQEVQQQELRQQEIRQQELRQQQQLQEEVREEVREDTLNTMEDDEEEEEEARRKRLASPPAHSRFLALGVPAARGGMGGREGVGMGFPVYRDEAFRDDEEEMQQRVKVNTSKRSVRAPRLWSGTQGQAGSGGERSHLLLLLLFSNKSGSSYRIPPPSGTLESQGRHSIEF